jgi:hypothetical protein
MPKQLERQFLFGCWTTMPAFNSDKYVRSQSTIYATEVLQNQTTKYHSTVFLGSNQNFNLFRTTVIQGLLKLDLLYE